MDDPRKHVNVIVSTENSKVNTWSLWQYLFAAALFAACAFFVTGIVRKKWRIARRIAQIKRDCRGRETETILVLIHVHRNGDACARLIHNLFETALCPWRISVGVYQEIEQGDTDCFYYYRDYLSGSGVHDFSDRVRVRTVGDADRNGAGGLNGVAEGLKQLYSGEKYVFVLTPNGIVASKWDETMVNELKTAGVYSRPLNPIITSSPTILQQPYEHVNGGTRSSSAISLMQHMLAQSATPTIPRDSPPTFITMGQFNHLIPTISNRMFANKPARPIRMLACDPRAIFCTAGLLRRAAESEAFALHAPTYAIPALISAALHDVGGAFYSPVQRVVWQTSEHITPRPRGWKSSQAAELISGTDWESFAGLNIPKRLTSGRSQMGLLDPKSTNEILTKYGSLSEFDRLKATLL